MFTCRQYRSALFRQTDRKTAFAIMRGLRRITMPPVRIDLIHILIPEIDYATMLVGADAGLFEKLPFCSFSERLALVLRTRY